MFCNIDCICFCRLCLSHCYFCSKIVQGAAVENGTIGTTGDESEALRFPLSLKKDNDLLTVEFIYWTSNRAEIWVI